MRFQNKIRLVSISSLSLLVQIFLIGGLQAEEYVSGTGALDRFDADAMGAASISLKVWLGFLLTVFACSLFFVRKQVIARWAIGGILAAAIGGHFVVTSLGLPELGGSVALAHIICWFPALILLLVRRPFLDPKEDTWFRIWSAAITTVILVSFFFDAQHSVTYLRHVLH